MRTALIIWMLGMNLCWSTSYVVFKKLGANLDAGLVVTFRYGLAALILLIAWPWLPGRAPRGMDLFKTALMGILIFVAAGRLQVKGVHLSSAADASVLIALEPLVVSLAAALFLGERLPPRRWLGLSLGLVGVVLLAQVWRPGFKLPGLAANGLIIASYVCETPWSIMGKVLIQRASLLKVVAVALAAGALVNVSLDAGAVVEAARSLPMFDWLLLIYLAAVCTVLGYSLWYVVIREAEVNVTALTVFIQPVFSLLLAVVVFGDPLHLGQLWGGVAIIIGLIIGLPRRAPKTAVAAVVICLSAFGAQAAPLPKIPQQSVLLFNGRDLSGFRSWLVDAKGSDSRRVFAVTNGQLRISGDGLGYLGTLDSYRDYHLIAEYRWGTNNYSWGDRIGKARDSGIFLHSFGPDGNSHDGQGAFKAAIECNIFQGATGDILLIRGSDKAGRLLAPRITVRVRTVSDAESWPYFDREGDPRTMERWGRVNWWGKNPQWKDEVDGRALSDLESAYGLWTRLECICQGDRITIKVNGQLANEVFAVYPSHGPILLQCEGSEIYFRRLELQPLKP